MLKQSTRGHIFSVMRVCFWTFQVGVLFWSGITNAQINHPKASPHTILTQDVGLTKITVDYSRPSKRGRAIIGDLVPFGRIWRVGANESTKVTFDQDVEIEGNSLSKGTYALYAIPEKDEWTMIIHKNTSHWGDGRDKYRQEEDALRFKIVPQQSLVSRETFSIDFEQITHTSALMVLAWENTIISFNIRVFTDRLVMTEIYEQIKQNPTASTYYQSARYLQEQSKIPKEALEWLDKAEAIIGHKYYIHRVRSLVQAQLGNYSSAVLSAEKSLQLAQEENKDEFVRMNQKNIDLWRKELSSKD